MFSFRRAIYKAGRVISKVLSCSEGVNGSGGSGIYYLDLNVGEGTGLTGIRYDAQSLPDWYRIYWDGNLVANSKYVGDNITQSTPTGGIVTGTFTLDEYNYTGGTPPFTATGTTTGVTILTSDIANRTTEPSDGNGYLLFNKTTSEPSIIKIVIVGSPTGSTNWSLAGICPTPQVVTGKVDIYYGFLSEANKTLTTGKTMKFRVSGSNFYTNELGDTDFFRYGWTLSTPYLTDGTTWYQIDAAGNIVDEGSI